MKRINHSFKFSQLGTACALIALSGCGVLLGGYGDDPPDGVGGNGGNGGNGESSSSASSGAGAGASTGSGSNTGGNAPVCSPTPATIQLGEAPLVFSDSTVNVKNNIAPSITSNCAQSTSGPERIYSVTTAAAGILTAMTVASGTSFDSVLYARKGSCMDKSSEICADRTSVMHDRFGGEVLSFPVSAGDEWYIVVDGYDDVAEGKGNFALSLSLRTGRDQSSVIPVRLETGSAMTLRGFVDGGGENDVFTPSCGGLGERVYKVEYGAGVQSLKFDVVPLDPLYDPALYATKTPPNNLVSPEVGCETGGCGGTATISTTPGTAYVVVDGALKGFPSCANAKEGPYNLIVTPTP